MYFLAQKLIVSRRSTAMPQPCYLSASNVADGAYSAPVPKLEHPRFRIMTMKARQNWICLENCKSKCQTCGERPSHRTTDRRDELAPLHLAVPSALA